MRIAAHLLSLVLMLPGLAFAVAFLALDHLVAQRGWLAFFAALFELALILLPWGFIGIVVAVILLGGLGCSTRYRWAAAIVVAALVVASTATLIALGHGAAQLESAGFFVPGALAFAIATWLAISEWPPARRSGAVPRGIDARVTEEPIEGRQVGSPPVTRV